MNFKEISNIYIDLIEDFKEKSNGIKYESFFLEPDFSKLSKELEKESMINFYEIYTMGIIERSHLTCITSLARSQKWLESSIIAIDRSNALSFAASLRGFLESSADAFDILSVLPATIHKIFPYLFMLFNSPKNIDQYILFTELENKLIHYAYAREVRRGEVALPFHQKKTNAEYIRHFESFGINDAYKLYGSLCELTHPAASSVSCFYDVSEMSLELNFKKDSIVINEILKEYEKTIERLMQFSMNSALLGLSFINRLFSEYPAPSDNQMETIGRSKHFLSIIDDFTEKYKNGVINSEYLEGAYK